jgi:hypothetical protein
MTKKNLIITIFIIFIVAISAIAFFVSNPNSLYAPTILNPGKNTNKNTAQDTESDKTLLGMQTGNVPWVAEKDNLKERLSVIGLPALKEEGTTLHTHQHLDIFINGQLVAVPTGIGVNQSQGFISPLHTHDTTGVIHVESPTVQKYYLGQFFDVWGVEFTKDCIGGYCNSKNQSLKVYVSGERFQGDPRTIELQPYQEIVITYGTLIQTPFPIPSSYTFTPEL